MKCCRNTLLITIFAFIYYSMFPVYALSDEKAAREFEFATALIELGMPDYAKIVVKDVLSEKPEWKNRAKVIESRILIKSGKLDEALEMAGTLPADSPSAQTIKLLIAQYYYYNQQVDRAKKIYKDFFSLYAEVPEDPVLKKTYIEAAYTQAQMLRKENEPSGVVQALQRIVRAQPDENIGRKIKVDLANAQIDVARISEGKKKKKACEEAQKLAEEITFGPFDLFFGQAISILANVQLQCGSRETAIDTIDTYYKDLKQIDKYLEEKVGNLAESPLAPLRFLRGELYFSEAEEALNEGNKDAAEVASKKAAGEFYNVFIKYGNSRVGGKAGLAFNEVKEFLKDKFDLEIKINIPEERMREVAEGLLRFADEMFNAGKYEDSILAYEEVLNDYPETEASPGALYRLAVSYAEGGDRLYPRMIAAYIAERMAKYGPAAGNQLLKLGKYYSAKKENELSGKVLDAFVRGFPDHDKAAQVLFLLAESARKAGDEKNAVRYRDLVKEQHKNDPYYLKVLNKEAFLAFQKEDYKRAAEKYAEYAESSPPGFEKAQARFFSAFSLGKLQEYKSSLMAFNQLKKDLLDKSEGNPYRGRQDREQVDQLVEKVIFNFAQILSQVPQTNPNVDKFREFAVKNYNEYLEKYPDNQYAPKALYGRGRIELLQNNYDLATGTFNELASRYPDSEEGRNALFSLVRAAIDADQKEVAQDAVRKMLNNTDNYGADEFIRVGQMVLDIEMYEEARSCLEIVKKHKDAEDNDAYLQRALYGLGLANYRQGDCAQATENLNAMLEKFPHSALLYDIYLLLAESYLCQKEYDLLKGALKEIYLPGKDKKIYVMRADLINAAMQVEQDEKKEALASYFRIIFLGDPTDKAQAPLIKTAVDKALPLSKELELWDKLKQLGEIYIDYFPAGEHLQEMRNLVREMNLKLVE